MIHDERRAEVTTTGILHLASAFRSPWLTIIGRLWSIVWLTIP
jgi:hypothetical protein